MDIDSIGFEDGEPATVTVTMSVQEAAQLTQLLGKLTPSTEALEMMYGTFTDILFAPYWPENGADDIPTSLRLPERVNLDAPPAVRQDGSRA